MSNASRWRGNKNRAPLYMKSGKPLERGRRNNKTFRQISYTIAHAHIHPSPRILPYIRIYTESLDLYTSSLVYIRLPTLKCRGSEGVYARARGRRPRRRQPHQRGNHQWWKRATLSLPCSLSPPARTRGAEKATRDRDRRGAKGADRDREIGNAERGVIIQSACTPPARARVRTSVSPLSLSLYFSLFLSLSHCI